MPLHVHGRVAALLFADSGEGETESNFRGDGLAVLARLAEMSLMTLSMRHPAASAAGESVGRRTSQSWHSPEAPSEPDPPTETMSAGVTPTEPPSVDAVALDSAATPVEEPAPDLVETPTIDAVTPGPTDAPSTASISPVDSPAALQLSNEDLDLEHRDARRFAKLLVSEILLYNEQEVQEGRHNRDISERLRKDLQRSEEMYLQRVPSEIAVKTDYFREEVVRALAEGDPDLMGQE